MINNNNTVIKTTLKGHTDQVISIQCHPTNPHLIASSSLDNTVRIWDLRLSQSISLYKSPITDSLQNILFPTDQTLLVSNTSNILSYDLRTPGIIHPTHTLTSPTTTNDINQIAMSHDNQQIASIDDEGQVVIYSSHNLTTIASLQDQHSNIGYTIDFLSTSKGPSIITGGFDSCVRYWQPSLNKSKNIDLSTLSSTYIQGQLLCPPLVYSVSSLANLSLVCSETGHIFGLNAKEPKKPKFIIDGHLAKVIRAVFHKQSPEILVSISNDLSFAIWNLHKRDTYNSPSFVRKIAIDAKPNWLETNHQGQVMVATTNHHLYIYTFKP